MQKVQLSESEKDLLTVLGKSPDISLKELVNRTKYKRVSSIVRKFEEFREEGILYGPIYDIDFGKLCKNPLRMLCCIVESSQASETVISFLRLIEPLVTVYPVLSPRKEFLNVLFLSSDTAEMRSLLQVLKDSNIITDYIIHVQCYRMVIDNPNFFGDTNPSLDHLLDPCSIPDLSFGNHDTNWTECDINVLPYLRRGYKGGKLIEILKAERKLNKTWTYHQIKYSREKMLKNGLIEKKYCLFPFSLDQCVDFNLFLKTEDENLTQRILYNFARGERVSREYTLFDDWGYIGFGSHPQFLTGLMSKLDKIEEITGREIYQLRSIPDRKSIFNQPPVLNYFDFDKQTLEYPYRVYREKIREKIENED